MKNNSFFLPADILIPREADMTKWSVIAVDQFTSESDYWRDVENTVGGAPSTLRMVIPENYLEKIDVQAETKKVNAVMDEYLDSGVFQEFKNSLVYVRREITGGKIRRGLLGMVDLEQYDYTPGASAPIRATEQTVKSRLPARIDLRRNASLEMPHSMLLINDSGDSVMGWLESVRASLPKLYDFDLCAGGGHIEGYLVSGENAERAVSLLEALWEPQDAKIIVGDGNHSLAAAKECWVEKKRSLPAEELKNHPARYALSELVNIYDESMDIEPIHRLMLGVDPDALLNGLKARLSGSSGYKIGWARGDKTGSFSVPADTAGQVIEKLQELLDGYIKELGGDIDYVHGDGSLLKLSAGSGRLGLLFPELQRGDLFSTVEKSGVFPRKSFSIGSARDKRYYLECRKIVR